VFVFPLDILLALGLNFRSSWLNMEVCGGNELSRDSLIVY